MSGEIFTPTRRRFGALVLSVPLSAAATRVAGAEALEARLAASLRAIDLPHRPAELQLVRLSTQEEAGSVELDAVVRLIWPPGLRQRRFRASGASTHTAFDRLEADLTAYYTALT